MSTKKWKIVFIGNSIVNGFPHKRSQCFVSLYREATGFEVINKGSDGETTPGAAARFEADVIAHRPDKMVFLGGTNDYIYGVCTPEETIGHFKRLSALSKAHGIIPIFLIPLMVDVEMAGRLWIPETDYNAVAAALLRLRELMLVFGEQEDVQIIDTQSFYSDLYSEETKTEFLRDGLHPTVLGHQKLAEFLVPLI